MSEEYEYHSSKKPGKTYVSRSLQSNIPEKKFRIASKVIDSEADYEFIREKDELVLRVTPGGRQEVVVKFFEESRGIFVLTIQRFSTGTGNPHKAHFSFVNEEIDTLLEFISNLKKLNFPNSNKINVRDSEIESLLLNNEQASTLIRHNQELVLKLAKSEVTKEDIVALGYRKKQLSIFKKLLNDKDFFGTKKKHVSGGKEKVWQNFFEKNSWIFGYALSYIFMTNLNEKKLEQIVQGYDFSNFGKRADAVLKTKGFINSLCLVEIKHHETSLLSSKPYRSGTWAASSELNGAISQAQNTAYVTAKNILEKVEIKDSIGNPTGETIFNYQPKSFVVIGNLKEFSTALGINSDKLRSFELLRKSVKTPEIITFDELYQRAKFIVKHQN